MSYVKCSGCENRIEHPTIGGNACGCMAENLPMGATSHATVRDVLNMTVKNLHMARRCESFKPSIPVLDQEIGLIV